ncbi:MAG: cytochrome b [Acidimicrobiales bacterium]|nr:cytochrome b [Hyphomonadaceae bacterium]RZV42352.1 MAG: cytochrome b [Acidimicrobiales bacterium]
MTLLIVQATAVSPSTPDGWLPHFESVITLAIIMTAFLIAWLLNHAKPKARALGTSLSALACFGIVAWFGAVLGTGVIQNPKEFQVPMDAWKPALLWMQMIVAFCSGLFLLIVANRQLNHGSVLDLPSKNEASRYGRVSRIFHWTTAILFIFMIPTGIFASMIPENVWFRTEYSVMHKTIGFILLGLVIIRLIWNHRSTRPTLDHSLKPKERKLAHSVHILMYILMIAVPVTGYVMTSFHGYASYIFTLKLEPFLPKSDAYIIWGLFHKYLLQYLVYIILGAHVLGALKHHFIDKHADAIKRMVS